MSNADILNNLDSEEGIRAAIEHILCCCGCASQTPCCPVVTFANLQLVNTTQVPEPVFVTLGSDGLAVQVSAGFNNATGFVASEPSILGDLVIRQVASRDDAAAGYTYQIWVNGAPVGSPTALVPLSTTGAFVDLSSNVTVAKNDFVQVVATPVGAVAGTVVHTSTTLEVCCTDETIIPTPPPPVPG